MQAYAVKFKSFKSVIRPKIIKRRGTFIPDSRVCTNLKIPTFNQFYVPKSEKTLFMVAFFFDSNQIMHYSASQATYSTTSKRSKVCKF